MELPDELQGWPNFTIEPWGELGALCLRKGLRDFLSATLHIWNLPYQRTSNPYDISCVIRESRGTCSSKHAFLAALAREHGYDTIQIEIVVYRMHQLNTPHLQSLLEAHNIDAIPDTHCRINYQNKTYDFTFAHSTPNIAPEDIIEIHLVHPSQIPLIKQHIHKAIIAQWAQRFHFDPDILWKLREASIEILQRLNH